MANNNDYGYFGKGTEGYAHYKQAFDESQKQQQPSPPPRPSSGLPGYVWVIIGIATILFVYALVTGFGLDVAFESAGYFLVAVFILWKIFSS